MVIQRSRVERFVHRLGQKALPFVIVAVPASAALAQGSKVIDITVPSHTYQPAKIVPTDERLAKIKLPAGFRIQRYAGLSNPRMIAVADNGNVYVTQRDPGTLSLLRDTDGDGVADSQRVVAKRKGLHGVAVHRGQIFLATEHEVLSARLDANGVPGPMKILAADLPNAGQHPNRTVAVGPDGKLYVTVGSTTNDYHESAVDPMLATVLRMNLDGSNRIIFASGLRNTIGFGWHPGSGRMYGWDHGIDTLGDDLPQEEVNELVLGGRYGFPYVIENNKPHPRIIPPPALGITTAQWAARSRSPALMYTAHSAGIQMAFYGGSQFPAEYRSDAFVALRGSWNRKPPSGYELVRIHFDEAGNAEDIEPFATGFLVKDGAPDGGDGFMARLAGVAVAGDGALLVSDDTNNLIYRIAYGDASPRAGLVPFGKLTRELPEFSEVPDSLKIESSTFAAAGPIPDSMSGWHGDQSPELSFSGVPAGTRTLVLMVEDPDAMSPKPTVHWLLANLPATTTRLRPDLPKTGNLATIGSAVQGANVTGSAGWFGPKPPPEPAHHYHFQLFALDSSLNLPAGYTRDTLLNAMRGHVLARGERIGTYQREPPPPAEPAAAASDAVATP